MANNKEQSLAGELVHLDAYAPTGLVRHDGKNTSSTFSRLASTAFALGVNALFLCWLNAELEFGENFFSRDDIIVLEFLQPTVKRVPVDSMPDVSIARPHTTQAAAVRIQPAADIPPSAVDVSPTRATNRDLPLALYDDLGRIKLPVDFVEKNDQANVPGKRFDFQNPNLEMAGTFLKRPPAIDFEPTQFEDAWKPDQDILTAFLEKAVEKTMREIKIPVPGNPRVMLVCKVSILAAGGGCGFVPNGGYGRVIADDEDDPDTLSPEEDRECQAWFEKINDTKSQREWLKTRGLYEASCRKPLAKEKTKAL